MWKITKLCKDSKDKHNKLEDICKETLKEWFWKDFNKKNYKDHKI